MHGHPLDLVFLDPGIERGLREAHDTQRWVFHAWPPGLLADGQPYFKRRLGGEIVKAQGGQQADHTFGYTFAGLGQRVMLGDATVGEDVKSSADPLQFAGLAEAAEVGPRDVAGIQIPWTQNACFSDQFQDLVCPCGLGSHDIGMLHYLGKRSQYSMYCNNLEMLAV